MLDISLMDTVLITIAVLITMALVCCLCCMCMKYSDMRMRKYLLDMARKKGVQLDLDKLEPRELNCGSPVYTQNCTIYVPEVGIIL